MPRPLKCLTGLTFLLLLTGCLHPPVSGYINCTGEALACKEFVTIEGIHIKFKSCAAHIFNGHMNAGVFCAISNPTGKDQLLRCNDFRLVSKGGEEMIPDKSGKDHLLKKGGADDYVFSAHTKDGRSQKDFREFIKTGVLAFLHQGGNLTPDTLFTMHW